MMKRNNIRALTYGAAIAAIYAVLCIATLQLSYGPLQFRLSEALCVLPLLTPAAIPGLFVGCILANLFSSLGPIDLVVGSLATLLAALGTRQCRHIRSPWARRLIAPLFPVLMNGVFIGLELTYVYTGQVFGAAFFTYFIQIVISEALVCYAVGVPLLIVLERIQARKTAKERE